MSCTDTAAVVALLKEVGAPKKFSSLIEGESLLNDATCMILIIIATNIMKGTASGIGAIALNFVSLVTGGVVIGCIYGILATFWIKKIYYDSNLIVNITLVFAYLAYFTSQEVEIMGQRFSGIISVVTYGIIYILRSIYEYFW